MSGSVCKVSTRCHALGRGIATWGSDFPAAMVKQISSSSVVLVIGGNRLASGTLIWSNVVLAAGHSFQKIEATSVEVLIGYEIPARVALNGDVDEHSVGNPLVPLPRWTKGAPTDITPQAKVVQVLQHIMYYDLMFVRIEWNDVVQRASGLRAVALPRAPIIPRPGRLNGKQIAVVGHPWDTSTQAEPTQVLASPVTLADGPDPMAIEPGSGFSYYSGEFHGGFSGGGAFNSRGELVGVIKGGRGYNSARLPQGSAFANLATAAADLKRVMPFGPAYPRLRQWLGGGPPLMDGEPTDNVIVAGPQAKKEQPVKRKR